MTRRAVVTIVCILGAIAAVGLGGLTLMDVALTGFPDSHVTDYGRAAHTPLTILGRSEVGLGLVFLAVALWPMRTRTRAVLWLAALIALILAAVAVRVGIPWYFGTHLGLDNGIGG
jgi:hypothetical protein